MYFTQIVTPILLCLYSILSFLVLNATRLPELFKKGKIWQIQSAYVILSITFGYILTQASFLLINLI